MENSQKDKQRDTSYSETHRIIDKYGLDKIYNYWRREGPKVTASYLHTRPTVIRYIAKKHEWQRPADYCPNIMKTVQRGLKKPEDYPHLFFEPAMVGLDPDLNKEIRHNRETNPYATWLQDDYDLHVDTNQPVRLLNEHEIPCIRQEINIGRTTIFLVMDVEPNIQGLYWYITRFPMDIYHSIFAKNYISRDRMMKGKLLRYELNLIDYWARKLGESRGDVADFFERWIDQSIESLQNDLLKRLAIKSAQRAIDAFK